MFKHLDKDIQQHAMAMFPNEACGIIVNDEFIPLDNIHPDKELNFRLPPETYIKYNNIQAIVHSHTNGRSFQTAADIQGQMNTGIPWGLLMTNGETCTKPFYWGTKETVPPLLGRDFRWGPSGTDNKGDCYALLKDYFLIEKNIELSEYPREPGWWNEGGSMYTDHFAAEGFYQISQQELQPGDILLLRWLGKSPHHAAIYQGNNLILHHLSDKLSSRDLMGRWSKFVTHYLRYNKT